MRKLKIELMLLGYEIANSNDRTIIGVFDSNDTIITIMIDRQMNGKYTIQTTKIEGVNITTLYDCVSEKKVCDALWDINKSLKVVCGYHRTDNAPKSVPCY